jgi:hypothetical protein
VKPPPLTCEELTARVLAAVERDPGISGSEIACGVGAGVKVVLRLLRLLDAQGLLDPHPGPRGAVQQFPKRSTQRHGTS